MCGKKFREASAHASGEVSACVFTYRKPPHLALEATRRFSIARHYVISTQISLFRQLVYSRIEMPVAS